MEFNCPLKACGPWFTLKPLLFTFSIKRFRSSTTNIQPFIKLLSVHSILSKSDSVTKEFFECFNIELRKA